MKRTLKRKRKKEVESASVGREVDRVMELHVVYFTFEFINGEEDITY